MSDAEQLVLKSELFSSYKNPTTLKGLIAISPAGHISFISQVPPFSFLGRILTKLKVEEVPDALVIAPWWPTAHWYSPLLQ